MKSLFFILFFGLATIFSGCSSIAVSENRPPSAKIDVFREGTKLDRKYREIGNIAMSGKKSKQPGIEDKMIRQAKAAGADAIIFERPAAASARATYAYRAIIVVYE